MGRCKTAKPPRSPRRAALLAKAAPTWSKSTPRRSFPKSCARLVDAGIPVFAQFGLTPQTASKYGIPYSAQNSPAAQASAEASAKLIAEAKLLEAAGAALLDFTNSGPIAGAAVAAAVKIPVIGGFGGGPWLDGRVRLVHTAIGYGEKWLDGNDRNLRQHRQSGA